MTKTYRQKRIAAIAAVQAYIEGEEEAVLLGMIPPKPEKYVPPPVHPWGVSARQTMMANRQLMQLKAFHGAGPR